MMFYETLCSLGPIIVFLQSFAAASAVNNGYLARAYHAEDVDDPAPNTKRSLVFGGVKRASGVIRPTMLVAERQNLR